jgi:sterol desaturase/sphingolipid hydroxylase (fatty acid hydroxylase superfamily)
LEIAEKLFHLFANRLSDVLLASGTDFSLTSLVGALGLAALYVLFKLRRQGKPLEARALMRALFPRRVLKSPSSVTDLGYFFFNVFVFGIIFGWAVLSYQSLSNGLIEELTAAFGQRPRAALPEPLARAIVTLALFLAYELGYWIDHYLSHKIPFLWAFHKVHHTARVLTPLTVWRVHPINTLVASNILAFSAALANGLVNYLLGETFYQYAVSDNNIILVLFIHAYVHLQHSHVWIAFTGIWGRLFLSPAHHQVHHSSDPKHFNKNLGSCIAIWDWLFGTLHVPDKARERFSYGVALARGDANGVTGALIAPFYEAFLRLMPSRRARPRRAETLPATISLDS